MDREDAIFILATITFAVSVAFAFYLIFSLPREYVDAGLTAFVCATVFFSGFTALFAYEKYRG